MGRWTNADRWREIRAKLEDRGVAATTLTAADWHDRYGSNQAVVLTKKLDLLGSSHLSRATAELIGEAVLAAFQMGKECECEQNALK